MTKRIKEILRNNKTWRYMLLMIYGIVFAPAYGRVIVPDIPLDECKHRVLQSYDKDALFVLDCMADCYQSLYYFLYSDTNFPPERADVYAMYCISGIYHDRFTEMDSLTLNVLRTVLEHDGISDSSIMAMLAKIYGIAYKDTLRAAYWYNQMHPEYTEEARNKYVQTRLKYMSESKSMIIQEPNSAQPDTPDDWRYRIFWNGDISAYNQLMGWARQSGNIFDFYECLYYSLVMAGKYVYEPAMVDLREILNTMIHKDTPDDALAIKLLRLLQ